MAPKTYDETIIILDLAVFLIGTINLLKNSNNEFNIISFNVIFLLSFFFCTYSYALFVIGAGVEFSMTVFGYTDFSYITKAVSLSTIAITFYFIAYSYPHKKRNKNSISDTVFTSKLNTIGKIRFLLAISVVGNALYFMAIQGNESAAITSAAFLPELYKVFLIVYLLLNKSSFDNDKLKIRAFYNRNKWAIVESLFICLLYILVGDRGLLISIVFIYLGVYSFFYKKIKVAQFAVLAVVGAVFLFAIRVTRASDSSFTSGGISAVASTTQESLSGKSAVLVFSDLMSASCELCLGYEYVDKNGFQYPGKAVLIPFQPIPFLPSIVARLLWDKVPYDMAAGSILNDYIEKTYGYSSSLGNHIVADLYMHWGVLGVILFIALFGRFISYLDRNKYSTLFHASAFIFAISYALYLPRDSVFTLIRPVFFIWLVDRYFKLTKGKWDCKI